TAWKCRPGWYRTDSSVSAQAPATQLRSTDALTVVLRSGTVQTLTYGHVRPGVAATRTGHPLPVLPDHQFQALVQVCGLHHLGLTDVVGEQLRGFLLARNMVDRGGLGETRLRVAGVGDDVTIGQQNRLDLGGQPFDSGVV